MQEQEESGTIAFVRLMQYLYVICNVYGPFTMQIALWVGGDVLR